MKAREDIYSLTISVIPAFMKKSAELLLYLQKILKQAPTGAS